MNKEYGICRVSLAPMRSLPDHSSEQVSQLLFGEHYTVEEFSADGAWLKIIAGYDKYEGWIQKKQHHLITVEYFEQLVNSDYKICTDVFSSILFNKNRLNILIGSILPITVNEIFKMEEQFAFNGESKSLNQRMDTEFVRQISLKYLNAPYLWGGKSPFGIDCSGFTQMVFRISGYLIPRESTQQAEHGELVKDEAKAKCGNLAFFTDDQNKIDHVGIILSDGIIIHASGYVRIDKLTDEGIINSETGALTHRMHSIRSILI